jgi:hypothetical protein
MFKKTKKSQLKKYIEIRKEKISIFGNSVDFDWFIVNVSGFILIIFVLLFSIIEIRSTLDYAPTEDFNPNTIIRDQVVINKMDAVILKFEERENNVGSPTEEETATSTEEE